MAEEENGALQISSFPGLLTAPKTVFLPFISRRVPVNMKNPRLVDGVEGLCTIIDDDDDNNKEEEKKVKQDAQERIIFGSILRQLLWRK